jgi:hypothetical protein
MTADGGLGTEEIGFCTTAPPTAAINASEDADEFALFRGAAMPPGIRID